MEWCGFETEHHIEISENEGEIRYFRLDLVALWQSNVRRHRENVLRGEIVVVG